MENETEKQVEPTFLEEMEKKKTEFAEIIKDAEGKILELKNLRAIEVMSGKSKAGNTEGPEEKKETPAEYSQRMLRGG